jgi:hypothetical protein
VSTRLCGRGQKRHLNVDYAFTLRPTPAARPRDRGLSNTSCQTVAPPAVVAEANKLRSDIAPALATDPRIRPGSCLTPPTARADGAGPPQQSRPSQINTVVVSLPRLLPEDQFVTSGLIGAWIFRHSADRCASGYSARASSSLIRATFHKGSYQLLILVVAAGAAASPVQTTAVESSTTAAGPPPRR